MRDKPGQAKDTLQPRDRGAALPIRPAHPATVIQCRPAHPATVIQCRPAHPATVAHQRPATRVPSAGAATDPLAVAQPFWKGVTGLATAGAVAGYAYESINAGATLGTLAMPGVGTAIGAVGGLVLAGLGAGLSYYYSETPEAKERRESIEAALKAYRQLKDDIDELALSAEKSLEKRKEVQLQITSRIGKLERLQKGSVDPKDDLSEVLGWAKTAAVSVSNLTAASLKEAADDENHSERKVAQNPETNASAGSKQPTSTRELAFRVDDTLADLIAMYAARAPAPNKAPSASSSSCARSAPMTYPQRKAKALAAVKGEFTSWASDVRHYGVMFHSAFTIPHGSYSAIEKADLRAAIQKNLPSWITGFGAIHHAKVLSGKLGKGQNFNIGAYDAKDKMVLNLHFIW